MNRRKFLNAVTMSSGGLMFTSMGCSARGNLPSKAPMPEVSPESVAQDVIMLVYPGMTALDLVGPQLYFSVLGNVKVHLVAKSMAPVESDTGLSILPTASFDSAFANPLVLFVPGGSSGTVEAMQDKATLEFLKAQGAVSKWVTSVCTGALVLGAAGLLDGYRATTHWVARELLPLCKATAVDARLVVDRNRITGAGVTAGLDLGLRVIQLVRSEYLATVAALNSEYAPSPPVKAGTPAEAGPEATKFVADYYRSFLDNAKAVLA